ncbi:hypothetical protein ACFLIN_03925 [Corynebacterium kutscheri]|uniref:hypothetical protein n=1 Tax=Corynebacterium kutscheri TaxID=35755 RepID=UPI0037C14BF8
MSKETDWFSDETGRRVTVTEIADLLAISRRTATNRLSDGLSADELITVSRALSISPIHALIELGKLTLEEAFAFVDGDGRLLANANETELLFELAKHQLPISMLINLGDEGRSRILEREMRGITKAPIIDDLAKRRHTTPEEPPHVYPFPYDEAVADTSPDEEEGDDHDYYA